MVLVSTWTLKGCNTAWLRVVASRNDASEHFGTSGRCSCWLVRGSDPSSGIVVEIHMEGHFLLLDSVSELAQAPHGF